MTSVHSHTINFLDPLNPIRILTKRKFRNTPAVKVDGNDSGSLLGSTFSSERRQGRVRFYINASAAGSSASLSDSVESEESGACFHVYTKSTKSIPTLVDLPSKTPSTKAAPSLVDRPIVARVRPLPPLPVSAKNPEPQQIYASSASSLSSTCKSPSAPVQSWPREDPRIHSHQQSSTAPVFPSLPTPGKATFGPRPPKAKHRRRSVSVDSPHAVALAASPAAIRPLPTPQGASVALVVMRSAPATTAQQRGHEPQWDGEWNVKDVEKRGAALRSLKRR